MLARLGRLLLTAFVALLPASDADAQPAWQVRPPEPFGFSADRLQQVFDRAADLTPLNSLLIARGDSLVAAQTFGSMRLDTPVNYPRLKIGGL